MSIITHPTSLVPEIDIPQPIYKTLGQFNFPCVVRNMESRIIYCNKKLSDIYLAESPDEVIGKFDREIDCPIFDTNEAIEEFDRQYQQVCQRAESFSTLEIHPNALDYPYIFHKMPFFDENGTCIGMFGYDEQLSNYSLNDYVKGKMPGSLLLNKPDDFFTERQCEIMFYRLHGLKSKEVAQRLNLATNTFNNYMQTLYDKCCVSNLDEFIEFCEKRNYHRYLPKRFLTCEAINFSSSII